MGVADFAAGFFLGAKTGERGFDEVVATGKEILASEEFAGFVAALRSHAAYTLRELGDLVDANAPESPSGADLIDFVKALVERRDAAVGFLKNKSGM
jgi:hypothetical protein